MTALTLPLRERDPPGTHASEIAAVSSSPVHKVCASPPVTLTLPKPELPSTFALKRMRSGDAHAREDGDALRFGVTFRAGPPLMPPLIGTSIGTTTISPPARP